MGAGAVAAAGVITLAKTLPTIWSALTAGLRMCAPAAAASRCSRDFAALEQDLPMKFVVFGSLAVIVA